MVQPHDDDPGWFTPTDLVISLIPVIGLQRAMSGKRNLLQQFRLLFATFANAIVLIGVVAWFVVGGNDSGDGMPVATAAAMVAAVGVSSVMVSVVASPKLHHVSPDVLVQSFRARFFVRMAYAEVASLVGFVGALLSGRWWLYPLGAVFTVIGFVRAAPTEGNLQRDQEILNSDGSALSLRGVLAEPIGQPG